MTPAALVTTAMLLGLFVLAGGGYGGLYGAGKLTDQRGYLVAAYACYVAQALVVVAIVWSTPLAVVWKTFLVLSFAAYAIIPPITWRYLEQLHRSEKHS